MTNATFIAAGHHTPPPQGPGVHVTCQLHLLVWVQVTGLFLMNVFGCLATSAVLSHYLPGRQSFQSSSRPTHRQSLSFVWVRVIKCSCSNVSLKHHVCEAPPPPPPPEAQ